mmetsp:Transcript_44267/g.70752  ORF Transcript_44267/g.70752 Transcript_44267/m.70752 type:complete len:379 (-) Transcript_44267:31-1167(-)
MARKKQVPSRKRSIRIDTEEDREIKEKLKESIRAILASNSGKGGKESVSNKENESVCGKWFHCETVQGPNEHMEDTFAANELDEDVCIYGVFDGHAGKKCSEFCKTDFIGLVKECIDSSESTSSAITRAFELGNAAFCDIAQNTQVFDGSTATVACCYRHKTGKVGRIVVANAGDSRAILVRKDGTVLKETNDHTCNVKSERERIEKSGGTVIYDKHSYRIDGALAVSRSIGDYLFKPFATATPEVFESSSDNNELAYLVIASDGIWDVLSSVNVGKIVVSTGGNKSARVITDLATQLGSEDNLTCLVVDLLSLNGLASLQLTDEHTTANLISDIITDTNKDEDEEGADPGSNVEEKDQADHGLVRFSFKRARRGGMF